MIKKIPISNLDKEHLFKNNPEKKEKPREQVDFTRFVVNKPWGCEYLVFSNPYIEIWHLFIKKLASTSVHCHPNKKTGLILLEGEAIFSTLNESLKLNPLDAIAMDAGVFHSTQAISEGGIHLLETETPPDKYNLVRLQDKYGRVKQGYEGREAMFYDRERSLRFLEYSNNILIEKDFYNKRVCIQSINKLEEGAHRHIKNSEIVVILDSKNLDGPESIFSVGDIIKSSDFFDNFLGKESTIMFISIAI